jgi:hypothetical protein
VPLIAMLLTARTWNRDQRYSRRMALACGALAVASAAALFAAYRACAAVPLSQFPLAYGFLAKASLAAAVAVVLAGAAYFVPRLRRAVVNVVTVEALAAAAGMALAFCATTFTIFGQWNFFLRSLDFYNGPGYRDAAASTLSFWPKLTSLVTFYIGKAAQDPAALALLITGTVVILARPEWRRRLWPYLTAAFGFFVTRPLDLQRALHHIALWVPMFAMVCAAGPAALIDWLGRRLPGRRVAVQALALAAMLVCLFVFRDGGSDGRTDEASTFERLRNVGPAFEWVHGNVPAASQVYTAFYCFGPDTFYRWMRGMGVQVPESLGASPDFRIWWWDRTAIRGRQGYACIAPELDEPFMKQLEARQKGEGVFPAGDAAFQRLRTFGQGRNRIDVYRFDLR